MHVRQASDAARNWNEPEWDALLGDVTRKSLLSRVFFRRSSFELKRAAADLTSGPPGAWIESNGTGGLLNDNGQLVRAGSYFRCNVADIVHCVGVSLCWTTSLCSELRARMPVALIFRTIKGDNDEMIAIPFQSEQRSQYTCTRRFFTFFSTGNAWYLLAILKFPRFVLISRLGWFLIWNSYRNILGGHISGRF